VVLLAGSTSILEDHGPDSVEDDAALDVPVHGSRQHAPLDVAALAHQIVRLILVRDALDVLLDDGPLVEIGRHIVCSRADQLDAAAMGLVVGFCTSEARKEWWMLMQRPASFADSSSDSICM
jgi:hypothetical protein